MNQPNPAYEQRDRLSEQLSIDTPENVALDSEIAGFASRCVAALIDYTIIYLALIVIYLLALPRLRFGDFPGNTNLVLATLLQFIIYFGYHALFELFNNGQTPGKRATRIRVVQANGLPLTAGGAIIRNMMRLIDFLPFFYALGLVMLFITKQTQRLGDMAARTVVIRDQTVISAATVKQTVAVTYQQITRVEVIPDYIQIERLDQDDIRLIVDYLQRRKSLQNHEQISFSIAQRIAEKMERADLVPTLLRWDQPNRDRFLEQVVRAAELFSDRA